MYVVCEKHLEFAIDQFVDEYETAPDIVDLSKTSFQNWTPPKYCERCKSPGRYAVYDSSQYQALEQNVED